MGKLFNEKVISSLQDRYNNAEELEEALNEQMDSYQLQLVNNEQEAEEWLSSIYGREVDAESNEVQSFDVDCEDGSHLVTVTEYYHDSGSVDYCYAIDVE